jgi:outer membrane protein assembly factor BamB
MKRISLFILCSLLLASCDHIGSTRVKNLIDLTSRLEIESNKKLEFTSSQIKKSPFAAEKTKSYSLAKSIIIAKPAIAKGVMYSADKKGYVAAYSLKEKKILWRTDIAKNALDRNFNDGGVLYSDGKLYVTNSSRYLVVLDAKSGDEIIRKEFPDIVRNKPIMATDRLLLVQTISNQLIAYDIKSSKFVWLHEGGIETISTRNHVHPVVYNGYAIVSYSSGEVVYLDAATGKEKWRYDLTKISDVGIPNFDPSVIVTTPIISGEYAYFATSNGQVLKMDLDNGAPAWVKAAEDVQSLSFVGDYLLITNNARQVAALSAYNGKVLWIGELISDKDAKAKNKHTAIFQEPFVSQEGNSFAINVIASNGELYQFKPDASGVVPSSPTVLKIDKNVKHQWISCCTGQMHLITKTKIIY